MRMFLAGLACWVFAATSAGAADLDRLFAELRKADGAAAAQHIERKIWDEWMNAGTTAQNAALAKATKAMNSGAYRDALAQLNRLLTEAPHFAEAWNKRATLLFLMGRYEESLADIAATLDLEPRHFGALSGRAMIYRRTGRRIEAIAAYKDALAIHPHMQGARHNLQQLEKLAPSL